VDDFQRDLIAQVCVERFVGNTHSTATKLDWHAIIASNQLILIEAPWSGGVLDVLISEGGT
jgi:hypothetical protein